MCFISIITTYDDFGKKEQLMVQETNGEKYPIVTSDWRNILRQGTSKEL